MKKFFLALLLTNFFIIKPFQQRDRERFKNAAFTSVGGCVVRNLIFSQQLPPMHEILSTAIGAGILGELDYRLIERNPFFHKSDFVPHLRQKVGDQQIHWVLINGRFEGLDRVQNREKWNRTIARIFLVGLFINEVSPVIESVSKKLVDSEEAKIAGKVLLGSYCAYKAYPYAKSYYQWVTRPKQKATTIDNEWECSVCWDEKQEDLVATKECRPRAHIFHKNCIEGWSEQKGAINRALSKAVSCPKCRTNTSWENFEIQNSNSLSLSANYELAASAQ